MKRGRGSKVFTSMFPECQGVKEGRKEGMTRGRTGRERRREGGRERESGKGEGVGGRGTIMYMLRTTDTMCSM